MHVDPVSETAEVVGPDGHEEEGPRTLRWSVHPVRKGGARLIIALFSIPLFGAAVYLSTTSYTWSTFAAGVLFLSLSRYFFRTHYTLTPDVLEARYPGRKVRRRWSEFASCKVERAGVFLSPYKKTSRLENFRGIFLLTGDRQEEVVDFVRDRLEGRAP